MGFKVTGIKAATVTHRESHQYNVENNYNKTLTRTTDRVTIRIDEIGDEVSVVTDPETQMHCILIKRSGFLRPRPVLKYCPRNNTTSLCITLLYLQKSSVYYIL